MKFLYANRIAPDGTPRSAASHLGIYCLPMSHRKDVGLIKELRFFSRLQIFNSSYLILQVALGNYLLYEVLRS